MALDLRFFFFFFLALLFVGNEMEIDFLCWFYQNKLNRSKKFQSNWFYLVLCLSSRQEKKRKCDLEFFYFIFYSLLKKHHFDFF